VQGNPQDVWIDKIETEMGRAIPATMMYKHGRKDFIEKRFRKIETIKEAIQFKTK